MVREWTADGNLQPPPPIPKTSSHHPAHPAVPGTQPETPRHQGKEEGQHTKRKKREAVKWAKKKREYDKRISAPSKRPSRLDVFKGEDARYSLSPPRALRILEDLNESVPASSLLIYLSIHPTQTHLTLSIHQSTIHPYTHPFISSIHPFNLKYNTFYQINLFTPSTCHPFTLNLFTLPTIHFSTTLLINLTCIANLPKPPSQSLHLSTTSPPSQRLV